MKKIIFFLLLANSFRLNAQISEGGYPITYHRSSLKTTAGIPIFNLQALDINELIDEDSRNTALPERYSVFEDVTIDIKSQGLHEFVKEPDGEIWRYKVSSPDAKSIQLIFKKFVLPAGTHLYIYDETYSNIYGAFTSSNMTNDKSFVVADFNGDHLIIEYYEPTGINTEGSVVIGRIGQAYKDIFQTTENENGFVGINCPEGSNFQEEKHSVCRITFNVGDNGYLCTGTLLNNVRNDGTPYFLTANHCISDSSSAQTLVAYFNYENESCLGEVPLHYKALSGASMLSTGSRSDYTLLLLSDVPPPEYMPFYAGWDLTETTGPTSASIHHANGGVKRIAIDLAPPLSYDQLIWWSSTNYSPAGSHWKVVFDLGRTALGSSGAPLFNDSKKVIGQLHGGNDVIDFYGKLSYSWARSSPGNPSVKSYLDPENTDTMVIEGYFPDTNLPDAQFFSEFNEVCIEAPVALINSSAFNTLAWKWTIEPSLITYLDGTDSLTKNPIVKFNSPGTYNISLYAENSAGTDEITKNGYITVGDQLSPSITAINVTDSCLCNFDSLAVMASGAPNFLWSLSEESEMNFFLVDTAGPFTIIKSFEEKLNDTIQNLNIYLKGFHGSCTDTAELVYPLISQPNDNIANATPITVGRNGPFTNKCASVEEFEPVPPHFSCTDQLSWCNEVGVDIVTNSVWFQFTGPASGIVSVESSGFDNEIAIYEADSFQDILNGKYNIIAANDDRTITDYNPVIYSAEVTPGKPYWLQVDGSGGGSEGEFFLDLDDKQIISDIDQQLSASIRIYPQPAQDYVIIESPEFLHASKLFFEVFSVAGGIIQTKQISNPSDNKLMINTTNWDSGLYLLRIILNGDRVFYSRIVK